MGNGYCGRVSWMLYNVPFLPSESQCLAPQIDAPFFFFLHFLGHRAARFEHGISSE